MSKDGIQLSGSFPFPVATQIYKPQLVDKQWDLFFIGRSSAHREKHFGYLKHHYHFLHIAHGVWGPPLVNYLQKAKICLNIHAENEISWEPRIQMLLATGAFLISEKITPNAVLRPNLDYVEIDSPLQLREAVAYYLAHPEERAKISDSGCLRVQTLLAAQAIYPKLIRQIDSGVVPRFSVDRVRINRPLIRAISQGIRKFKTLLR